MQHKISLYKKYLSCWFDLEKSITNLFELFEKDKLRVKELTGINKYSLNDYRLTVSNLKY